LLGAVVCQIKFTFAKRAHLEVVFLNAPVPESHLARRVSILFSPAHRICSVYQRERECW
jgi:hypothetical protein